MTRQNLGVPSRRWAGRTPSRQLRQKQWTPPDLRHRPERSLSSYSERDYVIGYSTPNALLRIANLFTNGPTSRQPVRKAHVDEELHIDNPFDLKTLVELADTSVASAWPELDGQPLERFELPTHAMSTSVEPPAYSGASHSSATTEPPPDLSHVDSWGEEKGKGGRVQADEWMSSANMQPKETNWNFF